MEIRIKFVGGPIDGEVATTDRLQDIKVFFPPLDRIVLMYRRNPLDEELVYHYNKELSDRATEQYDKVKNYFDGERPGSLPFLDPPAPEKIQPFSDQLIIDDTEEDEL